MNDLDRTLAVMAARRWTVVLLEPGTKRLRAGHTWEECQTRSAPEARSWLRRGGGIGLDVHASGMVVLDIDKPVDQLCAQVGPLPPLTASSPSLGSHVYCTLPPGTDPAALEPYLLTDAGDRIGEVIRGPRQQVVMPPSPYPGNPKRGVPPGGEYRWLVNPLDEIYVLPEWWLQRLTRGGTDRIPADLLRDAGKGLAPDQEWLGPPPAELVERFLQRFEGARRYKGGAKGRCPGCAAEGHDRHRDNAVIWPDGRWGCAYVGDGSHNTAIGAALGMNREVDELADAVVSEESAEEFLRRLRR